ncbi:hypothetical protein C8Q74DRAFT_671083 [Fomes fomentarius]|nr:hypothetical protein C8Q74DRAFT_671083 [Fomes fomentarius]
MLAVARNTLHTPGRAAPTVAIPWGVKSSASVAFSGWFLFQGWPASTQPCSVVDRAQSRCLMRRELADVHRGAGGEGRRRRGEGGCSTKSRPCLARSILSDSLRVWPRVTLPGTCPPICSSASLLTPSVTDSLSQSGRSCSGVHANLLERPSLDTRARRNHDDRPSIHLTLICPHPHCRTTEHRDHTCVCKRRRGAWCLLGGAIGPLRHIHRTHEYSRRRSDMDTYG